LREWEKRTIAIHPAAALIVHGKFAEFVAYILMWFYCWKNQVFLMPYTTTKKTLSFTIIVEAEEKVKNRLKIGLRRIVFV
jgi:hypothetical protein